MASDPQAVRILHSVNYILPSDRGRVVLAGSHGGLYSGFKAVGTGVRAAVFNDAGVGLDNAGIASLAYAERFGVAVATVASQSARIGDGDDMLTRGVISHANGLARGAGVIPGMHCALAVQALLVLPVTAQPDERLQNEYRQELAPETLGTAPGALRVVCIDSASLIRPEDAGQVVLTGSHGGLIGGDASKAINVAASFLAFNDAGGGANGAGLGRLPPLQARGIAAVTVSHETARIGDALSTYETGVLSHVNLVAEALGARPGLGLKAFLQGWLAGRTAAT